MAIFKCDLILLPRDLDELWPRKTKGFFALPDYIRAPNLVTINKKLRPVLRSNQKTDRHMKKQLQIAYMPKFPALLND